MPLNWSKNFGSIPTFTTDEDNSDEVGDCNTAGTPSLMAPLLPRVGGTGRCTPTYFLPP